MRHRLQAGVDDLQVTVRAHRAELVSQLCLAGLPRMPLEVQGGHNAMEIQLRHVADTLFGVGYSFHLSSPC